MVPSSGTPGCFTSNHFFAVLAANAALAKVVANADRTAERLGVRKVMDPLRSGQSDSRLFSPT